ncbi:glycoside hydrolase family 28 protein [Alkaliflexus imshenetskii]|uniref:glycoside hydrolase family 28 protein n=1 Tax=Alkaliflexus imshenetskii TaxID=286730 RepID=UPI00047AD12E|nr:glycoside hydrolase family 28 protein [Alkaliflexus imshenetskii]
MKIRKFTNRLLSLLLLGFVAYACSSPEAKGPDYSWVYDNIEFDMPIVQEPVIPNNRINIADLGAIADGRTLNTQFFAEAIDKLTAKGGGSVIVPAGIWLTGPIVLKSNINIHLEDGALVRFSDDFDLYPIVESTFEGIMTWRCQSPISGRDLENISFTGNGVFDGNGQAWRPVKRFKMTANQWRNLLKSGGALVDDGAYWFPSESAALGYVRGNGNNIPIFDTFEEYAEVKDFLRPVMVSLINCKRVLLDGPTFQNSPAWNIHPLMCEHLTIRNLTVRNPWYSQNGDGLDLESCKNVVIYNNNFDVGDDAICFKSGRDKEGRQRGIPTENVIVKNNVVYHGHGGFVVGSEMSGGVRNVHVSECTFMGTNIGIRFKSTRGRGGVVENIYISNINMIDIPTEPIRFNLFYEGLAPVLDDGTSSTGLIGTDVAPKPVTEETPSFRNIFVKNVVANGFGNAALFMGLPEMKLQNVRLENAVIRAPKGFNMIDVDGVELVNVKIIQETGPALTIFNSSNVSVSNFQFDTKENKPGVVVAGAVSENIKLNRADFADPAAQVITIGGASKDAVVLN